MACLKEHADPMMAALTPWSKFGSVTEKVIFGNCSTVAEEKLSPTKGSEYRTLVLTPLHFEIEPFGSCGHAILLTNSKLGESAVPQRGTFRRATGVPPRCHRSDW